MHVSSTTEPDLDFIKAELQNARLPANLSAVRFETIRRNPDRRDYVTRQTFRVHTSKGPYHLTVGAGLEGLWKRTQAFAEVSPEIACKPLFFHRADNLDFLGVEFADGPTLEHLINHENFSAEATLRALETVVGALEKTFVPSTMEAALEELEVLFEQICASPMFGGLDQRFLREFVFPFVRAQVHRDEPRKRWTNGDFIAKNIIIDPAGNPRLIDYEFARATHFYGEDSWRWRKIADLPQSHRAFPDGPSHRQNDRWLEALFLLNQVVLSHETNGAAAAIATSKPAVDDLLRLVSEAHGHFRSSVFYQSFGSTLTETVNAAKSVSCQLFWISDGGYGEASSQRFAMPVDRDVTVHFRFPSQAAPTSLRFDPTDAPGLVTISEMRLRVPQTDEITYRISAETGWDALTLGSGAYRLADTPELNLLCLNDDPNFILGPIPGYTGSSELLLEVDLRFTHGLEAVPALLQPASVLLRESDEPWAQHPAANPQAQPSLHQSTDRVRQLQKDLAATRLQLQAERNENTALRQAYGESVKRFEQYRSEQQLAAETREKEGDGGHAAALLRIEQLSARLEAAEKASASYQDKCSRMSRSFSWRSTAALRLLRRLLIDRVKTRDA